MKHSFIEAMTSDESYQILDASPAFSNHNTVHDPRGTAK